MDLQTLTQVSKKATNLNPHEQFHYTQKLPGSLQFNNFMFRKESVHFYMYHPWIEDIYNVQKIISKIKLQKPS